jgi:hypothetical protein
MNKAAFVSLKKKSVIIGPKDNVATAFVDLKAGETLELKLGDMDLIIVLMATIPFGHKFCLTNVKVGHKWSKMVCENYCCKLGN